MLLGASTYIFTYIAYDLGYNSSEPLCEVWPSIVECVSTTPFAYTYEGTMAVRKALNELTNDNGNMAWVSSKTFLFIVSIAWLLSKV